MHVRNSMHVCQPCMVEILTKHLLCMHNCFGFLVGTIFITDFVWKIDIATMHSPHNYNTVFSEQNNGGAEDALILNRPKVTCVRT